MAARDEKVGPAATHKARSPAMDEGGLVAVPAAPEQMGIELPHQDADGGASRNKGCCSAGQLQLLPVTFGCMLMHTTVWLITTGVPASDDSVQLYYPNMEECHRESLNLVPWTSAYAAMGISLSGCGMSCFHLLATSTHESVTTAACDESRAHSAV